MPSPISDSLNALIEIIANSTTFQTWVGAADAEEAKTHIYYKESDVGEEERPLAMVGFGEDYSTTRQATNSFLDKGELYLGFEANVADGATEMEAFFSFTDLAGSVINDMRNLQGIDGFLSIKSAYYDEDGSPRRSQHLEEPPPDDYYMDQWVIAWGV
jgi:hypothetical protein